MGGGSPPDRLHAYPTGPQLSLLEVIWFQDKNAVSRRNVLTVPSLYLLLITYNAISVKAEPPRLELGHPYLRDGRFSKSLRYHYVTIPLGWGYRSRTYL